MTVTPKRIQRQRTKGWKMPENTICVTRGTRWGNPFCSDYFGLALAIQLFRNTMNGVWNPSLMNGHDDTACDRAYQAHHAFLKRIGGHPLECVSELRGKNLACWCPIRCTRCGGHGFTMFSDRTIPTSFDAPTAMQARTKDTAFRVLVGPEVVMVTTKPCEQCSGGGRQPCHADALLKLANPDNVGTAA